MTVSATDEKTSKIEHASSKIIKIHDFDDVPIEIHEILQISPLAPSPLGIREKIGPQILVRHI